MVLPEITIERPQNAEHGDYASNFPLKLARIARANPMVIANELVALLPVTEEIESAVVAPPGFINFTLKNNWLSRQVDQILKEGESFGNNDMGQGKKVQVEFVSINPTGPLHVGHGRGAILGSTLVNILSASGYKVEKRILLQRCRQSDGYLQTFALCPLSAISGFESGSSGKRLSGQLYD